MIEGDAADGVNIDAVWNMLIEYQEAARRDGYIERKRSKQNLDWMRELMNEMLMQKLSQNEKVKAILPVLWERNPDHRNLLPCFYDPSRLPAQYVRKLVYSREGANVELHTARGTVAEPGSYGAEGFVFQAYAPLPDFDGRFPVIGSWIVGDEAAGIGIRENTQQITTNVSRFIPHYFS